MTINMRLPEPSTTVQEPVTSWTRLDGELRMLCRGLSPSAGWTLQAVSTFVHLPDDAEYKQAIGAICRRLAAEYGLTYMVVREGSDWRLRFARPDAAAALPTRQRLGLLASLTIAVAAFRGKLLDAKY